MNEPTAQDEQLSDILRRLRSNDDVPTPEELRAALRSSLKNTLKKMGALAHAALGSVGESANRTASLVARNKRKVAAGVAAVGVAVPIVGWPAETKSAPDTAAAMRVRHAARYRSLTPEEQFKAAYTDPWVLNQETKEGGFGIRGIITPAKHISLIIGSTCLTGRIYDITPRHKVGGGMTDPATALPSASGIDIKPASGEPALSFTIAGGELIPSDVTKRILSTYGCTTSGILVQNGPEAGSVQFDNQSPELHSFHPGDTTMP